ncbi:hypothetical protein FAI40_09880 [Acetobacteraceae bacterium]|nr:hypothetical protein FAI40_09880 [Acetobacteraceae bacterium]
MMGIVTGLKAEADLARHFFPNAMIAMSNSTHQGAIQAVDYLKEKGVTQLLSFGCAGALASELKVGDILLPTTIIVDGENVGVSLSFPSAIIEKKKLSKEPLLAVTGIISRKEMKKKLFDETGAFSVDMESGAVATSGLPFFVLRVVCDESSEDLPPVALLPFGKGGKIPWHLIFLSLIKHPIQIPSLILLAKNGFVARSAMKKYLKKVVS